MGREGLEKVNKSSHVAEPDGQLSQYLSTPENKIIRIQKLFQSSKAGGGVPNDFPSYHVELSLKICSLHIAVDYAVKSTLIQSFFWI